MKYFKTVFNSIDWDLLTQTLWTNDSCNIFLERFIKIYDQVFPERKIKVKQKDLSSSWISKGLRKTSKRKLPLCEKPLKHRSDKNCETYVIYKSLFEKKTVKKPLCLKWIKTVWKQYQNPLECHEGCIKKNPKYGMITSQRF